MTIVELLVASMLLLVLMGAALSTVSVTLVSSRQARATSVASSIASAQIEEYRSFTFDSIAMDGDDTTIPATHDGYTVHKQAGCSACPLHTETISHETGDYTITRWVLEVDDPEDGTGASDADSQPLDYKRVVVDVVWDHARDGETTITTNILRDGTRPFSHPQGVSFEVVDELGERLEDVEDEFPLVVEMNSENYTGAAPEGFGTVDNVPTGSGFCTVSSPTILWESVTTGSNSHTQACSVTKDTITAVTSAWRFVPCKDGLGDGTSVITVQDGTDPVASATVTITQTFAPSDSFSGTTDANGEVTFSALPSGLYDVSVSGYDSAREPLLGELCSRSDADGGGAATLNYPMEVEPSPSPSPSPTVSPSPSPSPTPTSTEEFEFKWKIENLSGTEYRFRMRITPAGGGTEFLDGPKKLKGDGEDEEFKIKVDYKYDYFDLYIECETAPDNWETVFNELNLQAINPEDEGKKDVKLAEVNAIPDEKEDQVDSC